MAGGIQITCDVCGMKYFKKDAHCMNDFCEDGWGLISGIGTVCPECVKAYHLMVDSFIEERGGMPDESNDQN